MLESDHLVVVAPSLLEGLAHVHACLGLDLPEGGRHREMGTRNHLLRLGDGLFLEVIAVDDEAPALDRPRWFGLDDRAGVRADWAVAGGCAASSPAQAGSTRCLPATAPCLARRSACPAET